MKIFLIGMPGSGKSTVGKLLAVELGLPFIDLDVEIEKDEGKPVKEIFSDAGEAYFRRAESKTLKRVSTAPNDFIIATGGGAPCFHNGIDVINQAGLSIFLDIPVAELLARVEKDSNRPLLLSSDQNALKAKLETIRERRLPCYQQAKITVSSSAIESILPKINSFKN
jgi:shikimate kinase